MLSLEDGAGWAGEIFAMVNVGGLATPKVLVNRPVHK